MNNHTNFQISTTIQTAWHQVKGSKKVFWAVFCLVILVRIVQTHISHLKPLYQHNAILEISLLACTLIITLLSLMLSYGLYYIGAQRAAGLAIRFNMLRQVFNVTMFFKIIGNTLLNLVIFSVPMFILIILSILEHKFSSHTLVGICMIITCILIIFLWLRLSLSAVILAVEQVNPWRAVTRSFQATRGQVWKLLGLFILNILILIVSAIPLGIGLIWTLPYFFINQGVVYQKLAGKVS